MRSFGVEIPGERGILSKLSLKQRAGVCSSLGVRVSTSKFAVTCTYYRSTTYRTRERVLK
ncbi:hypothetical protein PDIP_11230 [Penicillium digitatum Pd1]|uniref:Uncharacterized protein n=1 Tax=Penicillium digitatum (strain Pd1 / CECT 20795) TaxID=1170230 RepID=K9GFR7_PEND1|nr:hypothetical protein PDIP_11230 [Penicillium digitatum Pd1]EKV20895.1 hypothetical protein PDIP_11230 [Penicillium digitatum Pd1]